MNGPVDLAVVGAGPAGAAAALAALSLEPGRTVVLLDKAAFPRDKACGDGIGPDGVDVLRALGAGDAVAGYPPVRRVRLEGRDGSSVTGRPPRTGYVIPRTVFDARLVAAAVDRGAELVRERVTAVEPDGDRVVVNGHLSARVVIGADGANSVVRRATGAGCQPRRRAALAIRAYAPAPDGAPAADTGAGSAPSGRGPAGSRPAGEPSTTPPPARPGRGVFSVRGDEFLIGFVEERWPAYVWSFPTGTGLLNVGYGAFDATTISRREDLVGTLRRALPGVELDEGSLRAHLLPLSTHRPPYARGRVLLAGDAASLINPLTGEGIYYALLSGALAGAAAARVPGDPGAAYARALRRRLGRHLRHTTLAAALMRRTSLVELAVEASARDPAVFADVCEFAVGTGLITPGMLGEVARASASRLAR